MREPTSPTLWPRPLFRQPSQRRAQIAFLCFHRGPLADLPLSRSQHGLPAGIDVDAIDARAIARSDAEAWVTGWWRAGFATVARRDLGADFDALAASDGCVRVALEHDDVADHGGLQACRALTRWLVDRGCGFVLDVAAVAFAGRDAARAPAPDRFDLTAEVRLTCETEPSDGDLHLVHTRGMGKWARPDLLTWVAADRAATAGRMLSQLAGPLADGVLAERLAPKLGERRVVLADADPALIERLGVADARVVRFDDGTPLA